MRKPPDPGSTTVVTSGPLTEVARQLSGEAGASTVRLVVLGSGHPVTHTLPSEGAVLVGRSDQVDLQIDEEGISRRHALLRIGPRITLEDLGSLNGTRIRERTLRKGDVDEVMPGEAFELGKVMCIVQRRSAAPEPRRRRSLRTHSYVEGRLDEELERRDGVDVAFARVGVTGPLRPGTVEDVLGHVLLPSDIAGEYGPGELEVIFLEGTADDAAQRCERLVAALEAMGVEATVGLAVAPRDGRTAASLFSVANAKVRGQRTADEAAAPLASGAMEKLKKLLDRVARSEISIVLHGETGVGKEVLAREIHRTSDRAKHPFVGINCAALTETLLESELFGHEKGAFSGAVATKPGLFEVAAQGTVFLDEIAEMSLAIQAKLLRVLEERQVLRVGGLSPRSIDVRFVAASHRDLEEEVEAGRFRQDLYFRLNGITLDIPPLRERTDEIEGLARTFLVDASKRSKRQDHPQLSREALELLKSFSWPGNVRELRNVIERAVLLCAEDTITLEHLPVEKMLAQKRAGRRAPAQQPEALRPDSVYADAPGGPRPHSDAPGNAPRGRFASPATVPPSRPAMADSSADDDEEDYPSVFDDAPRTTSNKVTTGTKERVVPLRDAVEEVERQRILDALRVCAGNQTKAAELLGISRRTLLNRLDQYGLPRPRK